MVTSEQTGATEGSIIAIICRSFDFHEDGLVLRFHAETIHTHWREPFFLTLVRRVESVVGTDYRPGHAQVGRGAPPARASLVNYGMRPAAAGLAR